MELKTAEEIMGSLERGQVSVDFAETVKAVIAHLHAIDGGKASVTLKLDFAAKGDMVTVNADLSHKVPKQKRRQSNFFMTEEGWMSTKHPNQMDMLGGPDGAAKKPSKTIDA